MSSKMKPELKKININELNKDQFAAWLDAHGIKAYRAGQVLKWIYSRQADTFDIMSDLSKDMRNLLESHFTIKRLEKISLETSKDGSRKYLFKLEDGNYIESVLIPEKDHYTLCISSQVGCAQGCTFCLTAKNGFVRNLTKSEILAQVRDVQKDLDSSMPLTNIVFMGMGEPLANYKNVIHAIQIITDGGFGLKFSSRRVTLSTAGLVPNLNQDTNINLAISLNASDNNTRSLLMPINKKYPIEKLIDACSRYKLSPRRRITFEYVLIRGINDSANDARRLVKLLRPLKAKINLIPFNEHEGCDYKRSEESVILGFQNILTGNNYTAVIRCSKGQDISAACGQLRAKASFIESGP